MMRNPFLITRTNDGMRREASDAAGVVMFLSFGCAHTKRNLEVGWARSRDSGQDDDAFVLGHVDGHKVCRPDVPLPSASVVPKRTTHCRVCLMLSFEFMRILHQE